jgi:hypothetical protein
MEENYSSPTEEKSQKPELIIEKSALPHLMETSSWGKFLSIIGFFMVGLLAIMGMITSIYFNDLSPGTSDKFPFPFGMFMGVFYFLIGLIYFFPILYLYKFSKKIKESVQSRDQKTLTMALDHQKSLFKFMGIFTIVMLAIYFLIFAFTAVGFLFR